MNDTRMGEWLRALPRTSTSPAFTSDVMRRIRCRDRRVPAVWHLAAGFAVAAFIAVVTQVAVVRHDERQRVAALIAEQRKLEAELEAVKRIARDIEPMVVLENDQGTRVVMDLDSAIQPAAFRRFD